MKSNLFNASTIQAFVLLLTTVALTCVMSYHVNAQQLPIKSRIVSTLINKKDLKQSTELIEAGDIFATTLRKGKNGEEDKLFYTEAGILKSFGLESKNVSVVFSAVHNLYQMAFNPLNNDELVIHQSARLLKLNIKTLTTEVLAGTGLSGYNGDNINATSAQIFTVNAITFNSNNEVVFSDLYRIRKILLNGTIVTIAGNSKACDGVTDRLSNIPAISAALCVASSMHHVKYTSSPDIEWLFFRDQVGIKRINLLNGMLQQVYQTSSYLSIFVNPIQTNSDRLLIPDDLWISTTHLVVRVLKHSGATETLVGGGSDQTSLITNARSFSAYVITSLAFDQDKNEMYIGQNGGIVKYVLSDRTVRHVYGCSPRVCALRGANIDAQLASMSITKPNIFFDNNQNQMYYTDTNIVKTMDLNSRSLKNYLNDNSYGSITLMANRNDGLIYIYADSYPGTLYKFNQTSKTSTIVAGDSYRYTEGGLAQSNSLYGLTSFAFNQNDEIVMTTDDQIRIIRNDSRIYTLVSSSYVYAAKDNSTFTEARLYSPNQLISHPTKTNELYFVESSRNIIRKMDFSTNRIITIAGKTGGNSGDGSLATESAIQVNCFTMDETGNIFFTDGNKLRKIDQASSTISTLTSSTPAFSPDGTELGSLSLSTSSCVLGVKKGAIYFFENRSVRKIHPTCESGYILNSNVDGCILCGSGLTNNEYFTECVPSCYGKTDSTACSKNGQCTSNNVCSCNSGWTGPECSQTTCFGVSNSDSSNVCSGKGSCIQQDTCKCSDGFKGRNCEFSLLTDSDVSIQTDRDEYVYNSDEPYVYIKFNTTLTRSVTLKIERRSTLYNFVDHAVQLNLTDSQLTSVITQKFPTFSYQYGFIFSVTVYDQETGVQLSNPYSKDVNIITCSTCHVSLPYPQYFTLTYNNTRPNPGDPVSVTVALLYQNFGYLYTFDIVVQFNNATYYRQTIDTVAQSVVVNIPTVYENGVFVTTASLYGQPFYKNSSYFMTTASTPELIVTNQTLFVDDSWISLSFTTEKIQFKSLTTSRMEMRINHVDFTSLFKDKQLTANVSMYLIDQYEQLQDKVYMNSHSITGSNAVLTITVPRAGFSIRADWKLEAFVTIIHNGTAVSNQKKTIRPITFTCPYTYFGSYCELTICNGIYSNSSSVCNGQGTCQSAYCNCNTNYKGSNCDMRALKSSSVVSKLDVPYHVKGTSQLSNLTLSINSSDVEFLNDYKDRSILVYVYSQGAFSSYLGQVTLDKTNNFSYLFSLPDSLIIGSFTFRLRFYSNSVIIHEVGSYHYLSWTYVVGSQPLPVPPPVTSVVNKPKVSSPPSREATTLSGGMTLGIGVWLLIAFMLLMNFTM